MACSISSMLYGRPADALRNLCGAGGQQSKCTCVARPDSRWHALASVLTMSYFTIWVRFHKQSSAIIRHFSVI